MIRAVDLTFEAYFSDPTSGRDRRLAYPHEVTPEILANARVTVERVRSLIALLRPEVAQQLWHASGWRPPAINAATPGAKQRSKHLLGMAEDIGEPRDRPLTRALWDGDGLTDWGERALVDVGLWIEHWSATRARTRFGSPWVHFQTVPPRSGNRVFFP